MRLRTKEATARGRGSISGPPLGGVDRIARSCSQVPMRDSKILKTFAECRLISQIESDGGFKIAKSRIGTHQNLIKDENDDDDSKHRCLVGKCFLKEIRRRVSLKTELCDKVEPSHSGFPECSTSEVHF